MLTFSKKPTNHRRAHRRVGFTLLEVVIALGLMGMLVGMIFRVAQSSMMLSQMVVEKQGDTMERNAFFNLLKNHFEQIPGNAVMRLETEEISSKRRVFTLTFQNVPMSFNWGETPMTAESLQLASVERRDGFIDVVLRFYDVKILDDTQSVGDEDAEPVAEITLIEDLQECDCEVVDGSTFDQVPDWDNNAKLPLLVKFYCRFGPKSDIVQQTFWVVPKQNPEVLMRQIMQKNPAGPEGTPEVPGEVQPPTLGGGGSQQPPSGIDVRRATESGKPPTPASPGR